MREAREGGGMLRSRGNRLPRLSEPLSFFLHLQPVSSPSPSFSIVSSILSPFLCLSNTERAEAVSLPFHHSGSSSVYMCVCMYIYIHGVASFAVSLFLPFPFLTLNVTLRCTFFRSSFSFLLLLPRFSFRQSVRMRYVCIYIYIC